MNLHLHSSYDIENIYQKPVFFLFISKGFSDTVIHFRAIRRRSSKEEGVATILLGTKSTKRTEEGLARLWSTRSQIPFNYRNSSAGDKKFEREGLRGQGQGGGKRQGGKEEKPRWPFACFPQFRTQTQVSQRLSSRPWQGRGISGCIVKQGSKATG